MSLYNRAMLLRTLGELTLEGASFNRPKPLLLLAYLALEGRKERRFLAELFWPGASNPRRSLSSALHQLRSGTPGAIEADESFVWSDVPCDAQALLATTEGGEAGEMSDLTRGPFLAGIDLEDVGVELEEWIYGTREVLANRIRGALIELAEGAAGEGKFKDAAVMAERAYFLSGAPEPEPDDFSRIHTLLVAGGSSRAWDVREEAASFDIILETDKATAQSILADQPDVGRTSLPEVGTSFVGRASELLELAELLANNEVRVLTIAGPGGVGKTRLALRVAKQQGNGGFPDGVYFVPLDSVTSPEMIPASIATAWGSTLQGGGDPLAQVMRFIGEKGMLLVLDNFEHLVEGATVVSELVLACPNLKVLVTTRERLNLAEESVFLLEGLTGVSGGDSPSRDVPVGDAVKLFAKRAKSANLGFGLTPEVMPHVLRICEMVGGSPLGIELAAAWVRMMPVEAIAKEIARDLDFLESPLRNVEERHQNLRAVFDHSWGLLSAREQGVLRKLSVFRGGFTREAAGTVAGASIPVLASLVDKSLLRVLPSGRFDRHPLVLQYSGERLAEHPEELSATEEKHWGFFLDFAREQREVGFDFPEEYANVRAAWDWALAVGRSEGLPEVATTLSYFFMGNGRLGEGMVLFDRAIEILSRDERAHSEALGVVLTQQAHHHYEGGRNQEAFELIRKALEVLRPLGVTNSLLDALPGYGQVLRDTGEYAEAKAVHEEALALARQATDRSFDLAEFSILSGLGWVERFMGNFEEAERHHREAIVRCQERGDEFGVFIMTQWLAEVELDAGRPLEAIPVLEEAIRQGRALRAPLGLIHMLRGLGQAYCDLGRYQEALGYLHEAQAVRHGFDTEADQSQRWLLVQFGRAQAALEDEDEATDAFQRCLAPAWSGGHTVDVLEALVYFGQALIGFGQAELGCGWLFLAAKHPATAACDRRVAERVLAEMRERVPEAVFARAEERGESLSLDEVVAEALGVEGRVVRSR